MHCTGTHCTYTYMYVDKHPHPIVTVYYHVHIIYIYQYILYSDLAIATKQEATVYAQTPTKVT